MHFSCLTSGTLLARLGRPEVSNCIAGLKQYHYAYDEAGEEASEMERAYGAALAGESDVNHMASVVIPPTHNNQAMAVDPGTFVHNNDTLTNRLVSVRKCVEAANCSTSYAVHCGS